MSDPTTDTAATCGRRSLLWPGHACGKEPGHGGFCYPAFPRPATAATERFDRAGQTVWRSKCDLCAWTSRDLPFPDPDAALHALALHEAVAHE